MCRWSTEDTKNKIDPFSTFSKHTWKLDKHLTSVPFADSAGRRGNEEQEVNPVPAFLHVQAIRSIRPKLLATAPPGGGRLHGASTEEEDWRSRAEGLAALTRGWTEQKRGGGTANGRMRQGRRQSGREQQLANRTTAFLTSRGAGGALPSCCKPRPSTNLWELNINVGSPILCRRGTRL